LNGPMFSEQYLFLIQAHIMVWIKTIFQLFVLVADTKSGCNIQIQGLLSIQYNNKDTCL
jgi:hypothetical protein